MRGVKVLLRHVAYFPSVEAKRATQITLRSLEPDQQYYQVKYTRSFVTEELVAIVRSPI